MAAWSSTGQRATCWNNEIGNPPSPPDQRVTFGFSKGGMGGFETYFLNKVLDPRERRHHGLLHDDGALRSGLF